MNYPNISHTNAMYTLNSGKKARRWIKEGKSRSAVITELKTWIDGRSGFGCYELFSSAVEPV